MVAESTAPVDSFRHCRQPSIEQYLPRNDCFSGMMSHQSYSNNLNNNQSSNIKRATSMVQMPPSRNMSGRDLFRAPNSQATSSAFLNNTAHIAPSMYTTTHNNLHNMRLMKCSNVTATTAANTCFGGQTAAPTEQREEKHQEWNSMNSASMQHLLQNHPQPASAAAPPRDHQNTAKVLRFIGIVD